MKRSLLLRVLIALLISTLNVIAQDFVLKFDVIANGGGKSSSTDFILTDTPGQPYIGTDSSASYKDYAGFWHIVGGSSGGTISGNVFNDISGNGNRDEIDNGLVNWRVRLSKDDVQIDSTLSGSGGAFSFTGLSSGIYTIRIVVESGWIQTLPQIGFYDIELIEGQVVADKNFGNFRFGSISGQKFHDIAGDGEKNGADSGLANWRIRLMKDSVQTDSTLTDASGNYFFSNLGPGNYVVSEKLQPFWFQRTPVSGTYSITLLSGDSLTNHNFGNYQPLANSITVSNWRDPDGDFATRGDLIAKRWRIRLYKDSISVSTLKKDTTASSLIYENAVNGIYVAVIDDSSGWTHLGKIRNGVAIPGPFSADTFTILPDSASIIDFINFHPNTAIIRKLKDGDGIFATLNDRFPRKWRLSLFKGSFGGPLQGVANAESLVVNNLGDGSYTAYETDSSGWNHVGRIYTGGQDSGSVSVYTFSLVDGESKFINFINYSSGTITVSKYLDQDGNFTTDGDRQPKTWGLKLYRDSISQSTLIDSTSGSSFSKSNLPEGTYVAAEADSALPWSHIATVLRVGSITTNIGGVQNQISFQLGAGQDVTAEFINFNRNRPKYWSGTYNCQWNDGRNWYPPSVPIPGDTIIVPDTAVCPLIIPPNASVGTISIALGETVKVQGGTTFAVMGDVKISGALVVNPTDDPLIRVRGNWEIDGDFIPGLSRVLFEGDTIQRIGESNFHNVQIGGGGYLSNETKASSRLTIASIFTEGNLTISGSLKLIENIDASNDTIFIVSNADTAVTGSGIITQGTISRTLQQGSTGRYQFESENSYIKLANVGTFPSTLVMTIYPDTLPTNFGLQWEVVPSVVDTVKNTITADSVKSFSRWAFGARPAGLSKNNASTLSVDTPNVRRIYSILQEGGSGFSGELSLRYEQTELAGGFPEDSLVLMRIAGNVSVAYGVNSGWNMVSLPVSVNDPRKSILFPSATSNAFAYFAPPVGYASKDTILNGAGYWLKFPSSQTFSVSGVERIRDTINVSQGWNMIGSISTSMPTSSIITIPSGIISSPYWKYSPTGYSYATAIDPGKSYWLKVSQAGKLVLSSAANLPKQGLPVDPLDDKFSKLMISDVSGNSQTLYFGSLLDESGKSAESSFELPPPPPAGIFDARYSSNRILEIVNHLKKQEYPIQISSGKFPITIRWDVKSENIRAWLKIGQKEILLNYSDKVSVDASELPIILKVLGSPAIPEEYGLEQNYPNPFNPITIIRYQLPIESKVSLRIFNILGQVVATLVDEVQVAGYHSKEWNSSIGGKSTVASGIYYYRLEAVGTTDPNRSFIQLKRMILLR